MAENSGTESHDVPLLPNSVLKTSALHTFAQVATQTVPQNVDVNADCNVSTATLLPTMRTKSYRHRTDAQRGLIPTGSVPRLITTPHL